ncbi:hypothetical protein COT42_00300 [Candidatus Saganbacteria bacterium CG08_land_8_20_14_0_20_45_16]|uniref:Uncharacterized protein n=1 Tax=Candidatus Saganbacteria bacterium CG08_land_8_20_14_0_20_45_16 TaxID=2014293 RepID=A0A2H0Y1S5_UNCSA|nr:MAG: hypothetical protein COT42_00300 [Candidatus Saganbacteria bacterium CG08_land_8_20_14_0_20_45_16]
MIYLKKPTISRGSYYENFAEIGNFIGFSAKSLFPQNNFMAGYFIARACTSVLSSPICNNFEEKTIEKTRIMMVLQAVNRIIDTFQWLQPEMRTRTTTIFNGAIGSTNLSNGRGPASFLYSRDSYSMAN